MGETGYSNQATTRLTTSTQDSRDIIRAARQVLERISRSGHCYHRCGVMLGEFICSGVTQYGLFDDTPIRSHSERLMQLLDSLNQRGRTIWFGGQGIPERLETWKMQRKWLSPAYTTRLQDIPVVKA